MKSRKDPSDGRNIKKVRFNGTKNVSKAYVRTSKDIESNVRDNDNNQEESVNNSKKAPTYADVAKRAIQTKQSS